MLQLSESQAIPSIPYESNKPFQEGSWSQVQGQTAEMLSPPAGAQPSKVNPYLLDCEWQQLFAFLENISWTSNFLTRCSSSYLPGDNTWDYVEPTSLQHRLGNTKP